MNITEYKRNYDLETTHWWFVGMSKVYNYLVTTYAPVTQQKPLRILDAGCGTGVMLTHLALHGNVSGIDFSEEAIKFCTMRGLQQVSCQDACHTSFADNSFDLVTVFMMVEHVPDDVKLIQEMKRICRPGGRIILFTSAFSILWSEHDDASHHMRRYSRAEFKKLLTDQQLLIVKLSYFSMLLFVPFLVLNSVKKILSSIRKSTVASPKRTLFTVPFPLNVFLQGILQCEGYLLRWINLPFGVNIAAIVEK